MDKLFYINLDLIQKFNKQLVEFSNITENQIRDIWYNNGEEYLNDFTNLEYKGDIPLYQKMIFRFRNGGNKASRLFNGCDPYRKCLIF